MSFVKKVVRGIVDFVKKYWVQIAIVAAVVFTAGVATIGGWQAFMAVGKAQGFMSAIGSTMWAGVTGTAGSMGIGTGAKGVAATQMGVQGGGLGAGLGWGSQGLGVGMTAGEYGVNAAALNVPVDAATSTASNAAMLKGAPTGIQAAVKTQTAYEATAAGASKSAAVAEAAKAGGTIAGEGLSTGEALMWSSAISTGANAAQGMMQGKMYEDSQPKASWLVDLTGKNPYTGPLPGAPATMPGVQPGPVPVAAPGPSLGGAVGVAEAGALASTRNQYSPLMAASQPFLPASVPTPFPRTPDQPLMGGGSS